MAGKEGRQLMRNQQLRRPKLLDLFCGAGGATRGYQLAGFHVTGVDIVAQPHYVGDAFYRDNAFTFPLEGYDVVHASPPCQDHTDLKAVAGEHGSGWQLRSMRERLKRHAPLWILENVPGSNAGLEGNWTVLCGSSFGLRVRRHRWFTSNLLLMTLPCTHDDQGTPVGVYGTGTASAGARGQKANMAEAMEGMGITWMTRREIAQALPPAYTHFLGEQLMTALGQDSDAIVSSQAT
jgi:DNA (cytosine-5)-methyltransferase 1